MSKSGEQKCHPGASALTFSELRNKFTSMPLSAILYYFVSFSTSLFIHGLPFTLHRLVTPIFAHHFLTTTPVCHSHSRLCTILSTRLVELVLFNSRAPRLLFRGGKTSGSRRRKVSKMSFDVYVILSMSVVGVIL